MFVQIVDGEVVGIFTTPQEELEGFEEIADDDSRIADFYARLELRATGNG